MKKLISIVLVLCFVVSLASCKVKQDEVITGDVKNDGEISSADEKNDDADEEKTNQNDNSAPLPEQSNEQVQVLSIEELAQKLGFVSSDGGMYMQDAERLCRAIVDGDAGVFAEFTMGKREYYDFLGKAEISSYTLYPFEFSEEKLQQMNEAYHYPVAYHYYFAEFDVQSSECEEFKVGKNVYCFGLEMNPVSGNLLAFFVPIEMAEKSIAKTYDTDYVAYFIEEFSALYPIQSVLDDGRNYADSFDFSPHPHLITHLMARSGVYGDPPYTLEEVNEFITECFDGNEGLSLSTLNKQNWTSAGMVYPNDDSGRIYGCSWAHGGTSVVCDIVNVERDGKSASYTLQIYADFSKVAKAYTLVFHFDDVESELPVLTMVERIDNTQRPAALSSI